MKIINMLFILISGMLIYISCTLQEPGITKTTVNQADSSYFSRFMAIGDDFIAGYQNIALTQKHQKYSIPAQIARQAGADDFAESWLEKGAVNFIQPSMKYPGLGELSFVGYGTIELLYLDNPETPNTINPDPLIKAVPNDSFPYFDVNVPFISEEIMTYPFPYGNLGIPGIIMEDILKGKTWLRSESNSKMIDYILRNDENPYGVMPAFEQAKLFHPSILLCWVGMNDVLNYAQFIEANHTSQLATPTSAEDFAEKFAAMADSLVTMNTNIIVGNIPDITEMPYFNNVPSVVIDTTTNAPYLDKNGNTVALLGVEEGDKILTSAKGDLRRGDGIPLGVLHGTGNALEAEKVLDVSEIKLVKEAIDNYNAIIDSVCASPSRGFPVVDMYSFYRGLKSGITVAGAVFTDEFITGNFYSYDGLHPSDVGNGLLANEWLRVINEKLPVSVPLVSISGLISELQSNIHTDTTFAWR